jgi:acyl CoA:acetate/3-ketoacid CoA transferase
MTTGVAIETAGAIAERVPDGATVALTGSGIFLEADEIFAALERRFLETGHPRGLSIVHALGIGDGRGSGLGRFAHEGMVRRVIGGHWSWSPAMQRLARDNRIAAYSFPAGAISTLLREIGAGRPGLFTRIGLGTFADPRMDGGRINAAATESLVELVEFDGREWLRYRPIKIDVAIVRGTSVDPRGNVSLAREPCDLDAYSVALAARNSGGVVLAQVEEQLAGRVLPARLARIPGALVDAVLVAPGARKTYLSGYDPHVSGEAPVDPAAPVVLQPEPQGLRRRIAERALAEIPRRAEGRPVSVNFGFGIPGGVPALAQRAGVAYWGTVEQGIHNGALFDGPMFGAARDAESIVPSVDQFDFYSGGGIDVAFLGMGEMDGRGDVNVSLMGGTLVGPGGFVDITQTARKVVFCGAFEAKGLEVAEADGRLTIVSPGAVPKLVGRVAHVTFSGAQALRNGQEVLYVTERAVFRLEPDGVALVEISPGIDVGRDVLARMGFRPRLALGA